MALPQREQTLGLYISVPFCASKCSFCNFASGVFARERVAPYVKRLVAEIAESRLVAESMNAALPPTLDSIYFGGGTPSLLHHDLFAEIANALRAQFEISPDVEWTVECAPGQLAPETLDAIVNAGVNRVSFGVQSFIDRETAAVGRLHTCEQAEESIAQVRAAGILNISVDLLAGLPFQTVKSWQTSLEAVIGLAVPHASVYMLEVDDDSRLGHELLNGGVRYRAAAVPTDDAIATMYEGGCNQLSDAGIPQYEISNFAVPGFQSRHNLRYWNREPYLGFGLDAHSCIYRGDGTGVRFSNADKLDAYMGGEAREIEMIDMEQQLEEAWFLGLRRHDGVVWAELLHEFGAEAVSEYRDRVQQLAADELVSLDSVRVNLTARGRMMSNEVFGRFIREGVESL
jgi:oxygen-independent coproporphyrinogen III oxidase